MKKGFKEVAKEYDNACEQQRQEIKEYEMKLKEKYQES